MRYKKLALATFVASLLLFATALLVEAQSGPPGTCPGPEQCPEGNVRWSPGTGYAYKDGSILVHGNARRVYLEPVDPWQMTGICVERADGVRALEGHFEWYQTEQGRICSVVLRTTKHIPEPTPEPDFVPEPSSLALLGLGLASIGAGRAIIARCMRHMRKHHR